MTRKDDAPTFTAAIARKGGPVHLSGDDSYTLCGWVIRSSWERYEERVPLFTVRLSGSTVCRQCERAAQEENP